MLQGSPTCPIVFVKVAQSWGEYQLSLAPSEETAVIITHYPFLCCTINESFRRSDRRRGDDTGALVHC